MRHDYFQYKKCFGLLTPPEGSIPINLICNIVSSFCACVQNMLINVTFVIGELKSVSFTLFLEAFPLPLDPRYLLHILCNYVATSHCPKGILGQERKAFKNKLKVRNFNFPMTNVTFLAYFVRMRNKKTFDF